MGIVEECNIVDNVNWSRYRLGPGWRICAALLALGWVAALAICSSDCLGYHSDSGHATREAQTAPAHGHSDSDRHHEHDDSFCAALDSVCLAAAGPALIKPEFGLAFIQVFVSRPPAIALYEPEAAISRQTPERAWVFTPEVCLGPALRSHAPPVISLI